ncbi:hypothetical protein JCM11251_006645 [Rhodosporidiobolus azoricus]
MLAEARREAREEEAERLAKKKKIRHRKKREERKRREAEEEALSSEEEKPVHHHHHVSSTIPSRSYRITIITKKSHLRNLTPATSSITSTVIDTSNTTITRSIIITITRGRTMRHSFAFLLSRLRLLDDHFHLQPPPGADSNTKMIAAVLIVFGLAVAGGVVYYIMQKS